ncbi:hypothetical protein HU230_0011650 [Bradyrhizobium quebecense]|uniref:Helix-turn-helix domain-containing protein n=1 Tax=Bradyrhizobium quebecense TaxID=2748629 RepID=A0A973WNE5_9BRAD|nr:hypothetical protein [Bradyrhizobium quebecense]UGA46648.1 hypothetical protein HU230_0011650 [Bradyrhizobium quebecense]
MSNPWFRMYGDVINDPKVMRLPEAMRWRWVAFLCLASRNKGRLPPVADIAFALRMSDDDAGASVRQLCAAGLLDETEPGAYAPHNWEGRQYKSDSSTVRVREHRERLKREAEEAAAFDAPGNVAGNVSGNGGGNVSVTPQNRTEQSRTEQSSRSVDRSASEPKQIDLEEAIAAKRSSEPSRFDEFWQAYPRRDGPNPRKPAETRFNSLVKTGLDPAMLIAAARKLANDEQARGNVGTRFIPQACTWLNQQRWSDHAAVFALQTIGGEAAHEMPIEDAVRMFAKNGFWSRHAGPSPDLPGCRASAELLAKYGLAPDGRRLEVVAA